MRQLFSSFAPAKHLIFLLPDKILVYRRLATFLHRSGQEEPVEYRLHPETEISEVMLRIRREFRPKIDDKWYLGLPLQYFTLVRFVLPKAAEEHLDQAVHYALMRHIPFDLQETYLSYQLKRSSDSIDIEAVVAQKEKIKPLLQAVSSAGITLNSIFPSLAFWAQMEDEAIYFSGNFGEKELLVCHNRKIILHFYTTGQEGGEDDFFAQARSLLENISYVPARLRLWESYLDSSTVADQLGLSIEDREEVTRLPGRSLRKFLQMPYTIGFLPQAVLRQKKIASTIQYAALVFFLLALISLPISKLLGEKIHLLRLEESISQIKDKAEHARKLREENKQLVNKLEQLAEKVKARPVVLEILKEATEIVPETAWLYSLIYSQDKVVIKGQASSATAIIESFENSPLFHEVHFDSPVKKTGSKDRFTVVAKVVP